MGPSLPRTDVRGYFHAVPSGLDSKVRASTIEQQEDQEGQDPHTFPSERGVLLSFCDKRPSQLGDVLTSPNCHHGLVFMEKIMETAMQNPGVWSALSQSIAEAIEAVQDSIVTVHGGGRSTTSGVLWRPGVIVTVRHALRRSDSLQVAPVSYTHLDVYKRQPSRCCPERLQSLLLLIGRVHSKPPGSALLFP